MKLEQIQVGMRVKVTRPSQDAISLRGRVGTVIDVQPYSPYPVRVRFDGDGHEASVKPGELEAVRDAR